MASTQLADVVIPAVYASYTSINSPELTAFFESGAAVRLAVLDQAFPNGGNIAHLPFWKDLDATIEPNYSTDNPADVAVPQKTNAGEMITRVADWNQGYSAADLVQELAGSDPMQHIRNRYGAYWVRQWQRRVIAAMRGILARNIASEASDMVNSVALETTVGVSAANLFSRNAFTDAIFTLGDQFAEIVAIAVHSVVFARMLKNDDISFERPSNVDPNIPINIGNVPFFLGKRVIIDDGLPVVPGTTSGFKYISILFGTGAIGYGQQDAPVPVEFYRRPDQGNGGGVEQLWERQRVIIHPFGYQFTSTTIAAQSPTNAEMALAANWIRVVARKSVPLSFLITNG